MLAFLASFSLDFPRWLGLYETWEGAIFQARTWEALMTGLRITLPLLAAFLLLYEVRAFRMGEWLSERLRRRVAIVLTALAFLAYFDFFNPNVRYKDYIHRHEFFHYYLGSKYHAELGYKRIYECTAAAEMELGRAAQVRARELRDLRVNLIKKNTDPEVARHIEECREIFQKNPERWEAFKQDIDYFYKSSAGEYWNNMQKDHGYNPPPVWTMTGKLFSSLAPAGLEFFQSLAVLDVALMLGAVLMLFWAFGWRAGAIASIWWGCNYPANFYWTGGAFLRQDWFFFLVASLCLVRKRKFELGGFALMWSALLRVFPVLFLAGIGVIMVLRVVKEVRRGTPLLASLPSDYRRFLGGCVVGLGTLVPLSMAVTNGPESYREFAAHTLGTHNKTPLTNHMGLKTLLVHDLDGRMRYTRNDNLDDPFAEWKAGRALRAEQTKPLRYGILLGLGLWTAWALRRTKLLWVGLALSAPLAMSLVELTCYYYSMFIVAAVLARVRPTLGPVILASSAATQVLGNNYSNTFYWIDDKFAAQSWLFFLYSLLLLWGMSRPFSLARLSRWWNGAPEADPAAPRHPTRPAEAR